MKVKHSLRFQLSILFVVIPFLAFSQGKEANNWVFPFFAGITFNTIQPTAIDGTMINNGLGSASISDKNGNLQFYTNGEKIWNKNNQLMLNGDQVGIITTGIIIVPFSNNDNLYYLFNFGYNFSNNSMPFHYSVIDMTLDGGLGAVVQGEKNIILKENTSGHLTAVSHSNTNANSIWLVTHDIQNNEYFSFLVTPDSIISTPVTSQAGSNFGAGQGYAKISPNGRRIAVSLGGASEQFFELLHFDNSTGIVSDENIVHRQCASFGIEFSPNNDYLYVNFDFRLHQYDITLSTPAEILASEVELIDHNTTAGALQLGPDGKIYAAIGGNYLGVVNYPNEPGYACNFIEEGVFLNDGICNDALPTFIQSYLNDPEFTTTTRCTGQPNQFNIVNTNGIDSVFWQFHDPGNAPYDTSSLFSPVYMFSGADTFLVELTVWSGFLERTVTDTVIIYQTPDPDFGPDTTFCANEIIDLPLDAGPGEMYFWNGFNPGGQIYNVTSPGQYTVRVLNHGCAGTDTINVNQYPEPVVDTTGVTNSNANCGKDDGSIEGITYAGIISAMEWKDNAGATVGNGPDLTGVPAGIYTFHVYYGDSCSTEPIEFEIKNNNAPEILDIDIRADHCNQGVGELTVLANGFGPLGYSLDTINFNTSNIISGLTSGQYYVTVQDVNGCRDMMAVDVPFIPGPVVIDTLTTPEHGYAGDGTLTINATGDSLYYVMDGGNTQLSGTFTGLSAGDYKVTVIDKWGCERWVYLTVERQPGIIISAWAGNDYKCREELAYSTISADNFVNVKEFKAVLRYDNTLLNCISYHTAPQFPDVYVTYYTGSVEVSWDTDVPKTLPGNVPLIDLIFTNQSWGVSDIKWDSVYSEFTDGYGNRIADSLNPGVIIINNPPLLENTSPKTEFCEGEQAVIKFNYTGGTDPVDIEWQTPDNATIPGLSHLIDSISLTQAGNYTILARDANNCKDTLRIPVTVYAKPTSGFEGIDTIWFEHSAELAATKGYASYRWSNGDTAYFITVDQEGKYSVLMETTEGCTALSEVTMATTIVPINVPNAFTPNADGLNDTFRPVVNTELIRRYHLSVYNKWGERIFETSNPGKGWDGENALPGTYVWVIDFENRIGRAEQIKGSVAVIK